MQSANISTKTLDGNSQIFDLVAQEYADNGDTLNGKVGVNSNRGAIQQPSIYNRTNNASGIEFRNNGDSVCIDANGVVSLQCESTYVYPNKPIYLPDGTKTIPHLALFNATSTGLFRVGTNAMGLSVNNNDHTHFHQSYTEHFQQSRFPDGTVGAPAVSFTNDTDCGLYRSGANDIRMSANGTDVTGFNANTFTLYKPLSSAVQTIYVAKKVASPQQSLTSNTNNIITYDTTAEFSQGTGITYLTSPSSRFRCDVAGRYLFSYNASCTTDTVAGRLYFYFLQKNGSGRYGLNQSNTVANLSHIAVNGTYIFNLAVNDYVELVIYPANFTCLSPYGTSFPDYHCIFRLC